MDAAGVKILCQGRAKPDGADYRVLDADGKPVPFQLDFHDADHYSLLTFKVDNPKQKFYVYFGNPKATRAAEQTPDFPAPGGGPPTGGWVPHCGFRLPDHRPAARRRPRQGTRPRQHRRNDQADRRQQGEGRRPLAAPRRRRLQPVRIVGLLHQHLPRLGARAQGGAVPVLHRLQQGVVLVPGRQAADPLARLSHRRARHARRGQRQGRADRRAALPGVLPRSDAAGTHGLPRLAAVRRRRQFLRHTGVVFHRPARRRCDGLRRPQRAAAPLRAGHHGFRLAGGARRGPVHPRPLRRRQDAGRCRTGRNITGTSATARRPTGPRPITST